jgi:two-component system response regulator AtoC
LIGWGGDLTNVDRILVVDDELFVRELLLEFLSSQGYDVTLADCGEKALELAQTEPPKVALVDLKMPGMDGIRTLKEMKKVAPETLSIIMTGYPTIESSIEALRHGAHDYVIKPFKLNDLKFSIEKALSEQKLKVEISQLRGRVKRLEAELRELASLHSRT